MEIPQMSKVFFQRLKERNPILAQSSCPPGCRTLSTIAADLILPMATGTIMEGATTVIGRDLRPPVVTEVTDMARTRDTTTKLRQVVATTTTRRLARSVALTTTGLAMREGVLETDIVLARREAEGVQMERAEVTGEGLVVEVTGERLVVESAEVTKEDLVVERAEVSEEDLVVERADGEGEGRADSRGEAV